MYFWSDGNIWVHSVTGSPALDIVSAALFFLGVILVIRSLYPAAHLAGLVPARSRCPC